MNLKYFSRSSAVFLVLFYSLCLVSFADTQSVLTDAIQSPVGVAELSRGGTGTGLPGANAFYYNPAGAAHHGFDLGYENLDYQNTHYQSFNTWKLAVGILPISAARVFQQTKSGDQITITYYTLARSGNRKIDWGITYKTVDYQLGNASAASHGAGIDIGILAYLSRNFSLGVVVQDVYRETLPVPVSARAGLGYQSNGQDLRLYMDVIKPDLRQGGDYIYAVGADLLISDGFLLRGGWNSQAISSAGLSLYVGRFAIDGGLVYNAKSEEKLSYLLSFKFGINH